MAQVTKKKKTGLEIEGERTDRNTMSRSYLWDFVTDCEEEGKGYDSECGLWEEFWYHWRKEKGSQDKRLV